MSDLNLSTIRLEADDGEYRDAFGKSVDISGNYIIAGSHAHNGARGAAYIFKRVNGTWGKIKKLEALDGEANDQFGVSVAIDGGMAVVGAFGDDDAAVNAGAIYVFQKNQGGSDNWGFVAKLLATTPLIRGGFGMDVAVDGDTFSGSTTNAKALEPTTGFADVTTAIEGPPLDEVERVADLLRGMIAHMIVLYELREIGGVIDAWEDNNEIANELAMETAKLILTAQVW